MSDISHHILFNGHSGTALGGALTTGDLVARFKAMGHTVSIDADATRPFEERLRTARLSPAPVLVAAGGDGTVTALAAVAIETGKQLAVLPLGTANLLARDLSLPLTIDEWFTSYPQMAEREIDVGAVNGRVFLHKVVIGAVPGLAAAREKIRGRSDPAALFGFLRHFIRRLSRVRRFAVEVTPEDGTAQIRRLHALAVANNDYDEGLGRVFARSRLDGGALSLYALNSLTAGDALRLAVEMLMGNWRADDVLEIEQVRAVTVRTRRRNVRAMLDGEILMLRGPLSFEIRPRALRVLAPETAHLEKAPMDTPAAALPAAAGA